MSESEFSVDDAKKGLKTLGMHPVSLKFSYLELDLSNKDLASAEMCESFPSIAYLNISSNKIQTLKPLEKITCLIQLNASKNQLSLCLDFHPPHCTHESPTSVGHTNIGSMLTLVDLSDNAIEDLGSNLKKHPFIECLILRGNKISVISGLVDLLFLKVLDLSNNLIQSIQGLDKLNIRELNLEGNKLTTLDGLSSLEKLTSLNVSKNVIESLAPLQNCRSLSYIDASDNRILQIKEVSALKNLEWLNILILQDNPCYKKDHYRLRALYRLPNLKRLDKITVSFEEVIRAFNLYKCDGGDLLYRERVFAKYLPRDEFVDYSLQQLPFDDEGGRDDASSAAEAADASLEESSLSQSYLSRDIDDNNNLNDDNNNSHQQQIVILPMGAEHDKTGDDSSMNSSQASINQEKISDLPSVASMRRKVPQSLNSAFPRSLSAPAFTPALSTGPISALLQADMT